MIIQPGKQFINWFYEEDQKRTLLLQPKYQRNPIWSAGQKCFLIDSIISDCPIPQVYLNVLTTGAGPSRRTLYEVVDGQQRLRAILEYMRDEYALVPLTSSAYPVSPIYANAVGRKYSQLPSEYQDKVWNYPLAVQELRGFSDKQIRDMF
ncbi:MAG TPA: DUF262 domain-containing protein, partial [Clostridia bacterium]|nr:DUF262 domain-containing protein [Clostridia bacterium]